MNVIILEPYEHVDKYVRFLYMKIKTDNKANSSNIIRFT